MEVLRCGDRTDRTEERGGRVGGVVVGYSERIVRRERSGRGQVLGSPRLKISESHEDRWTPVGRKGGSYGETYTPTLLSEFSIP